MTSRRDIIQISSYYPPHLGGQENAVHDLATELAAAGHSVQVITSARGGNRGVQREAGVIVRRLAGLVFGHAPIMPAFPLVLVKALHSDTVVHLHIGQAFTPEMVWLATKLRGLKYIVQLHIDFKPSGPAGLLLPFYKRYILKPVLRGAYTVVVLNQQTEQIVRDIYQYTGDIHILHNGLSETYFNMQRPAFCAAPPKTLRLLCVGRFSKQKNIPVLLRALKHTNRVVHLDLIGDGEERETIEQTLRELDLTNVTLHGRLPRETVMKFYQTCHALIMPSLYEAQPLVLLEALAARIPIIGTNVIGVAEHIKDAGIIAEPTVQGIARGIEAYDKHYDSWPARVQRGYAAVQPVRWKTTLKKYEELYGTTAGT